MTVDEGDQARGLQRHPLAAGGRPDQGPTQDALAEVQAALVVDQACRGQEQRFVVDVELEQRRVRAVDDRLARAREPEGLLGVHDGPGLVEPVDEGARLDRGPALLEGPPHPQEAVAEREDRLRVAHPAVGEPAFDQEPLVGWEQVLGRQAELTGDHRDDLEAAGSTHLSGGAVTGRATRYTGALLTVSRPPGRNRGCSSRQGVSRGTAGVPPRPSTPRREARWWS